ncbi:MAG TPA: hypothetical protein DIT67_10505 [Octadecabacter sp.]|nr:hypothetical protein [Octadecabacter sp.]
MKAFFEGLGIIVALLFAGMIIAAFAPNLGIWIGLAFTVVPLVAIVRPLPTLWLGHRGFSLSVAFFVGLMTTAASFGDLSETRRLSELRDTDSAAYLNELEGRDQVKWLAELKLLDPDLYAVEAAKIEEAVAARRAEVAALEAARRAEAAALEAARKAEAAVTEAARIEEERKVADARRAEAEVRRKAEQQEKIAEYIGQLDREIASIPGIQASKYTSDVSNINLGLLLIGAWGLLYEQGDSLDLDAEMQKKRMQFRQLLVRKQAQLLPALRDAYGPAMRRQLWEADGSARTIGAGYRTVEFVSATFARNANIKQIHTEIRENLMMLRFTRAQYKWFRQASEFSYYALEVPKDSDIVKWESGGRYRVLR